MKKDILIFISDQHSGATMGFAGADVDTPNMDALRTEGTNFSNAYTPCPLCVPARMSFMSGQDASHTGVFTNADTLPDVTPTFLHSMVEAGYETVLIGRMHFVGADQRHGFTKRLALDFTPTTWTRPAELMRSFRGEYAIPVWFGAVRHMGAGESCVTFYDRMVTEAALDYLSQPHEKPQCIVVGTYGPHFPYVACEELYRKYKNRLRLPKDFHLWPEEFTGFIDYRNLQLSEEEALQAMAAYYALVEIADGQVGQVRKAFEEMSEKAGREHVFFYTSDHGDMNGSKGVYGKFVMFDGSTRIPMLAAGTGIPAGREVTDNVSLLDIAPTVCQMGGAEQFPEFDGKSLCGFFEEEYIPCDDRIVISEIYDKYIDPQFRRMPMGPEPMKTSEPEYGVMVRQGRYKFIKYYTRSGRTTRALYDMQADPLELEDLVEKLPQVAAPLEAVADRREDLPGLIRQQNTRARNARLFQAYEKAVDFGHGEMWTGNPPEGRGKPRP